MGIGNILQLSQVTTYILLFIISFFLVIPMSINLQDFSGNCLLYANGIWNKTTSPMLLQHITWGAQGFCNFEIFMGILSLLVSFILIIRTAILLFREVESSFLGSFITFVVNMLMAFTILVASGLLTTGFNQWCDVLLLPPSQIMSCEDASFMTFIDKQGNINTEFFFIQLGMGQFAVWTAWVLWMTGLFLSGIKIYKSNQQEDFVTSMNRERERLLQKVYRKESHTF